MEKNVFETLYRTYYRELYLYIYALCGRHALTEDILQETFLKALTSLKDSHTNMRAWLYVVARNLCLNCLKRERRIAGEELEETAHGQGEDVLDRLIRDEEQRELLRALQKLPQNKREVLLLRSIGGFQAKEVAAALQMTPEQVRVLTHRARKELKSYLQDREG